MANNVYCVENTTWYDTITLWDDAAAATLTSTWTGQCSNGVSAELGGGTIGGSTCSATNYKKLTTYTGQSFYDHADKATNSPKYNTSNGVGIKTTATFTDMLDIQDEYTVVEKLQFTVTQSSSTCIRLYNFTGKATVKNCIIEPAGGVALAVRVCDADIVNCVICARTAGAYHGVTFVDTDTKTVELHHCTIVKPADVSNTGSYVFNGNTYAGDIKVVNCALFGFASLKVTAVTFTTGSGYCATDLSTAPGSNNQTSATYADQFENVNDSTRDFRAK